MLVITRYDVPAEEAGEFRTTAETALQALTGRPGCTGGYLARNLDDPRLWTLTTTWASVGDYRRALSSYEVKLHAVPVMYRAVDEPTAYEPLITWTPDGGARFSAPSRADDADTAGPQR